MNRGKKNQRTILAADKRGDAFVGVCVQAVFGSRVNALVCEGPTVVRAGPLRGCSARCGRWWALWTGADQPDGACRVHAERASVLPHSPSRFL